MHNSPAHFANLVWRTMQDPLVAARNLVLVNRPGSQDVADFIRIRELIGERAPDIETFIARWDHPGSVTRRQAARRPSLVFSPTPLSSFLPLSGKIYCGRSISKLEQARRLQSAGEATPETVSYRSDTELDPSKWGELTVLKPDTGGGGKGIKVVRTKSLGEAMRLHGKEGEFGRRMIAQPYIDISRKISLARNFRSAALLRTSSVGCAGAAGRSGKFGADRRLDYLASIIAHDGRDKAYNREQ